jgi:hypothetical protein
VALVLGASCGCRGCGCFNRLGYGFRFIGLGLKIAMTGYNGVRVL